jgi:chromosome segregation ATPase
MSATDWLERQIDIYGARVDEIREYIKGTAKKLSEAAKEFNLNRDEAYWLDVLNDEYSEVIHELNQQIEQWQRELPQGW